MSFIKSLSVISYMLSIDVVFLLNANNSVIGIFVLCTVIVLIPLIT